MKTVVFIISVAVYAVAGMEGREVSESKRFLESQLSAIEPGLNAAKDLAGVIDSHNFEGFIGKVAGAASSYLSVLGPLVSLVLSVFPGQPSAEYQLLQRLFIEIENRFDQIDLRFKSLSRQIGFLTTQIQFAALEGNINAVQDEFKYISQTKTTAQYNSAVHAFSHTYDRSYEDSGSKLFHGIVDGGLTTDAFFLSFEKVTKYDRKKTQDLMMGTMNLLLRAATLEMVYARIHHDPNVALRLKTWQTRIAQVKSKMSAVDHDIAINYKTHAAADINDFATQRPQGSLSNADFSSQLYNMLHVKYYWRDWFVLASAVKSESTIKLHVCDYYSHDNHGRTIGVTSVDSHQKHLSVSGYFLFKDLSHSVHQRPPGHYYCVNPHIGFDALPDSARNHCNPYLAAGSYCVSSADAHIHAATGRLFSYSVHSLATGFVFG